MKISLRIQAASIVLLAVLSSVQAQNCGGTGSAGVDGSPMDTVSPRYVKVALNGRPLPDEKPQGKAEADHEKEQTYVDMSTLGLRHMVTDVYVPLAGSELALQVTRNYAPLVWNDGASFFPSERRDLPFGPCWGSNLGAHIELNGVYTAGNSFQGDINVIDDEGQSFRFYNGAGASYVPFPSSHMEQDNYLATMQRTSSGQLVLTKKYGTKLTFERAGDPVTLWVDRRTPYASSNEYSFFRLVSIQDRFGNQLNHVYYSGNTTLIPDEIQFAAQPSQKIVITKTNGLVTGVTDPNGNTTSYAYNNSSLPDIMDGANRIVFPVGPIEQPSMLVSVTAPQAEYGTVAGTEHAALSKATSGAVVQYSYTSMIEDEYGPYASIHLPVLGEYFSINLNVITNANGIQTVVYYQLDTSRLQNINGTQYPLNGNPPYVTRVMQLGAESSSPGGIVTYHETVLSTYENDTALVGESNDTVDGIKQNVVTDAMGNKRIYTWSGIDLVPSMVVPGGLASYLPQKSIVFTGMTISYQDANGTGLGSESYTFDLASNLSVSSATDISGNTHSYTYGDSWDISAIYPSLPTTTVPYRNYSDPTQQMDADGQVKTFEYANPYRVMTKSVDEAGRTVQNTVDSLERRTSESIRDTAGTEIQHTDFQYGNSTFPSFLTAKIVRKLGGETQAWTKDLETDYVPDSCGRVWKEIVDPSGLNLVTENHYDLNNNKTSVKDPRGNTTTFVYGADNRLREIDYPAVNSTVAKKFYVYDKNGNKVEEKDENGVATLCHYDTFNRVTVQVRDMNGNETIDSAAAEPDLVTQFAYNAVNSKTGVTDPDGNVTTMDYDGLQRLVTVTDPRGKTKTFAYGANSGGSDFDSSSFKPTQITDESGYETYLAYDNLYRPTQKLELYASTGPGGGSGGALTQYSYDPVGNQLSVTDPLGHTTSTDYDALNRPVLVTYADGYTHQTGYTTTGLKYREIDELGRETDTQYDAARRVLQVAGAQVDNGYGTQARPVTQYGYDANGNRTSMINPLGKEWDYAYDARNRKTQEQQPGVVNGLSGPLVRPTLATSYDLVGNVLTTLDPMGSLLGTVDPTLFRTEYTYDPANRKLTQTSPSVPLYPSGVGRPQTSYAYDKAGNILTLTDPDGHATTNTYDALNRLLTTTDGAGNVVTNGYDDVGNKTSVQDGNGHTTTFAYDGLKRNTRITDALGHATAFTFNALLKTKRTDAVGEDTTYTYDSRNRLTDVAYAVHSLDNRHQTYDAAGNLLAVAEGNQPSNRADVAYTYDALNRVLTEKSNGATHQYAYDLANNRVGVKYGGTNRTVISIYDALNRLIALSEGVGVNDYFYDLNGNVVSRQMGSGNPFLVSTAITTTYDLLNRRATISGVTSTVTAYAYGQLYDAASNLIQETEVLSGLAGRTVTNTYDGANRLTNEASVGASTTGTAYVYDAANNRTQKTVNGTATTYAYNAANQLTGQTTGGATTSYTYDANGSRQSRGGDAYVYDGENRLSQLTQGGLVYKYAYDYRTRRIARTENDVTTQVVFSGGTSVQEYDNFGTVQAEYIRGSDWGGGVGGILYSLRNGGTNIFHYNGRGDVVAQTSWAGSIGYQAQYEAFGKRVAEVGSTADRQKANTKEEDPTGLLNEGFRYRDLDSGTFITKDPTAFALAMGDDYWIIDGQKTETQSGSAAMGYRAALALNRQTSAQSTPPTSTAKDEKYSQAYQVNNAQGEASQGEVPHMRMHVVDPGEINWYTDVSDNPWSKFDPDGLRDVYVAIWNPNFGAFPPKVGHAAAFEMNGTPIMSSFPKNGGP